MCPVGFFYFLRGKRQKRKVSWKAFPMCRLILQPVTEQMQSWSLNLSEECKRDAFWQKASEPLNHLELFSDLATLSKAKAEN